MKSNLFTTQRSQLFMGERGTPRPVAESVLGISSSPQSRVSADGWLQNTLSSNKFPTINTKQSLSSASCKVLQQPTLQISKAPRIQARSFCYKSRYRHPRTQARRSTVSLEWMTGHHRNILFPYSCRGICSFQMIYEQWCIKALISKQRTYTVVSGMYPCSYYLAKTIFK